MNENNEKLWDEVIGEIDEKYIAETAETLSKHSGKITELTEIIVNKPEENKKSHIFSIAKIALASAAGLGLIIGAGVLFRDGGLIETTPSSTQSSETDTTQTSPEENSENMLTAEFAGYRVCMSYNENISPVKLQVLKDNEIKAEIQLDAAVEVVGEISPNIQGLHMLTQDVVAVKMPHENNGIEYDIYFFRTTAEGIEPLILKGEEKSQLILTVNEHSITCSVNEDDFMVDTGTKTNYNVQYQAETKDFRVTPYKRTPYADDETVVNIESLQFSENTEAFENNFYYKWESNYKQYLTVTPTSAHIAETDEGWFLYEVIGGEPMLYFVSKNNSEIMYAYPYVTSEFRMCDYYEVYDFKCLVEDEDEFDMYSVYEQGKTEFFEDFYVSLVTGDENRIVIDVLREGKLLYSYDTGEIRQIPPIEQNVEAKIYTHISDGNNIIALYTPVEDNVTFNDEKLFYDIDAANYVKYKVSLYTCTEEEITPFLNEDGEAFTTIVPLNYYSYTDNNNPIICFKVNGYTLKQIKRYYSLDFAAGTAKKLELSPMDKNIESVFTEEPVYSENSKIFEDVFYGKWELMFNDFTGGMEELNFTYYGDSSFESWGCYTREIAETKDGWYMRGINGGEGIIHFISKDDPDTVYSYADDGFVNVQPEESATSESLNLRRKCDYINVYRRTDSPDSYKDKDVIICNTEDGLTYRGIMKLKELTGFDLNSKPSEVTDGSGITWTQYYNMGDLGTGQTHLLYYDNKKIVYTGLYTANVMVDGFYEEWIDNLVFTAEKSDGAWITEFYGSSYNDNPTGN